MFEIAKLCNEYEKLGTVEKGLILTEKSVSVLAKVSALNVPEIDPVETLASFVLGSIVCDGRINEKEYLLMYPALVKVFGTEFDFDSIKTAFESEGKHKTYQKVYARFAYDFGGRRRIAARRFDYGLLGNRCFGRKNFPQRTQLYPQTMQGVIV